MKSLGLILSAFLIIFFTLAADNGVAPMVPQLSTTFAVSDGGVLWFITAFNISLVFGILVGNTLVIRYRADVLILLSVLIVTGATILFTWDNYYIALFSRFIFGFFCGVISCVVWWLVFHGIDNEKTRDIMISSQMVARPLAIAVALPLMGYLSLYFNWRVTFLLIGFFTLLSGVGLFLWIDRKKTIPRQILDTTEKENLRVYWDILKTRSSMSYYAGIFFNAGGYLGFYSITGIWFQDQFNLDFSQTSELFVWFGIAEIIASLASPYIVRKQIILLTLNISCLIILLSFLAFMFGGFGLISTVGLIIVFISSCRIYIFSNIKNIPRIFETCQNKGAVGTLVTLFAWFGFTFASFLQSTFLEKIGLAPVAAFMAMCLGAAFYFSHVAHKRVYVSALQ